MNEFHIDTRNMCSVVHVHTSHELVQSSVHTSKHESFTFIVHHLNSELVHSSVHFHFIFFIIANFSGGHNLHRKMRFLLSETLSAYAEAIWYRAGCHVNSLTPSDILAQPLLHFSLGLRLQVWVLCETHKAHYISDFLTLCPRFSWTFGLFDSFTNLLHQSVCDESLFSLLLVLVVGRLKRDLFGGVCDAVSRDLHILSAAHRKERNIINTHIFSDFIHKSLLLWTVSSQY